MDLARTQFISLVTKAITTVLGIAQSIIIVRILTPAEFGLVGLVMSIGSVIGVSQHLGIVDGAIREIAVRSNKKDIATIVWASHIVRQIVTIPLSFILFLVAPIVAGKYGYPEISPYIQIFAVSLIFQGLQDVWGATLTGIKRFVSLYVIQIITATINIAVFGYLTWQYGVSGFFWAIVLTTIIMVLLLAGDAIRSLRILFSIPKYSELRRVARQVIRIGAYTYIARIFFVLWQRLPLLILGATLAADELGYLNISMTFGSKLTIIAMALSEVNLSWMSSLFVKDREEFARQATKNMHRVLVLMLGLTLVMLFFTPEILRYIIGAQYLPAQPIILLMTSAFFLYALIDIGTSSVFVPADNPRGRALTFGVLTGISAILLFWILATNPSSLIAGAALVVSAFVSFLFMVAMARRHSVHMAPPALWGLLGLLAASVGWLFTNPNLLFRIIVFALLAAYILWEAHRQRLLPDLKTIWRVTGTSKKEVATADTTPTHVICFAGAFYNTTSWTNRQHITTRASKTYPVLYVEPRVWIFRYLLQNITRPKNILFLCKKIIGWHRQTDRLVVIAQWNLLPGSREYRFISAINHMLNRYWVLLKVRLLGFDKSILWIYDTEAAEYLSAFTNLPVLYDCVDDHGAQAGVDRNPKRVEQEEQSILARADLVTTTSRHLFEVKQTQNPNTHLVLNAGDVSLYTDPKPIPGKISDEIESIRTKGPILGSVGALDSYKVDFELLTQVAKKQPTWQFVFIGRPIVDGRHAIPKQLRQLSNTHFLGEVKRTHVPSLVAQFDICLIPYRYSRYNRASFPLKFWEFMATGKPIIASGTPELKAYTDFISYIKNASEFEAATTLLLQTGNTKQDEQVRLARKHDWNVRAQELLRLAAKLRIA